MESGPVCVCVWSGRGIWCMRWQLSPSPTHTQQTVSHHRLVPPPPHSCASMAGFQSVIEDDRVCPRQVDAHAARACRQDEDKDLGVGIEALHQDLALLRLGGAIQPARGGRRGGRGGAGAALVPGTAQAPLASTAPLPQTLHEPHQALSRHSPGTPRTSRCLALPCSCGPTMTHGPHGLSRPSWTSWISWTSCTSRTSWTILVTVGTINCLRPVIPA